MHTSTEKDQQGIEYRLHTKSDDIVLGFTTWFKDSLSTETTKYFFTEKTLTLRVGRLTIGEDGNDFIWWLPHENFTLLLLLVILGSKLFPGISASPEELVFFLFITALSCIAVHFLSKIKVIRSTWIFGRKRNYRSSINADGQIVKHVDKDDSRLRKWVSGILNGKTLEIFVLTIHRGRFEFQFLTFFNRGTPVSPPWVHIWIPYLDVLYGKPDLVDEGTSINSIEKSFEYGDELITATVSYREISYGRPRKKKDAQKKMMHLVHVSKPVKFVDGSMRSVAVLNGPNDLDFIFRSFLKLVRQP